MNKKSMLYNLKPFWIYFLVVFGGHIALFICPYILFFILPLTIVFAMIAVGVVYMVGKAIQKRMGKNKRMERIVIAAICSCLIVMIFPICDLVKNYIQWQTIYINRFWENYVDMTFIIIFAVHFLFFWMGEEVGYLANKNREHEI